MINSIEFYCGLSREMKALKCSEMCVKTDDMIELVSRLRYAESEIDAILSMLRQAEKDAARYRELRDAESETCLEFINAKARMASPEWLDGMVDEYMQCK